VIGGLLSAHLLTYKLYETNVSEINVEGIDPTWPCDGPLLRLASKVADRLLTGKLPVGIQRENTDVEVLFLILFALAFDTATGMPFGTVNLQYGVPNGETEETCVAGVGTFLIEFATLSRLTGNPVYENVAMRAMDSLWAKRSEINLVSLNRYN
jgi:mannosidase alpha-like ER degradation enhancer 2